MKMAKDRKKLIMRLNIPQTINQASSTNRSLQEIKMTQLFSERVRRYKIPIRKIMRMSPSVPVQDSRTNRQ